MNGFNAFMTFVEKLNLKEEIGKTLIPNQWDLIIETIDKKLTQAEQDKKVLDLIIDKKVDIGDIEWQLDLFKYESIEFKNNIEGFTKAYNDCWVNNCGLDTSELQTFAEELTVDEMKSILDYIKRRRNEKVLCLNCDDYVNYEFYYKESTVDYKGEKVKYTEKCARCKKCGNEVDVPGLWDENLKTVQEEYRKKIGR